MIVHLVMKTSKHILRESLTLHNSITMMILSPMLPFVLDNPITPTEVCDRARNLKPDKTCGPDGVSLRILSLIPAHSILKIAALFKRVFISGLCPIAWTRAKMFTIFKKGDRDDPDNYRDISVSNLIEKLYDMVICERLRQ